MKLQVTQEKLIADLESIPPMPELPPLFKRGIANLTEEEALHIHLSSLHAFSPEMRLAYLRLLLEVTDADTTWDVFLEFTMERTSPTIFGDDLIELQRKSALALLCVRILKRLDATIF